MSWDYDDNNKEFVSNEEPDIFDLCNFCYDTECPECGCKTANIITRLESTDLDGGRGEFMDWFVCTNCGHEY